MADFESLVRAVVTLCDPEEQERLREMEEWIVKGEVSSTNIIVSSINIIVVSSIIVTLRDPHPQSQS